MATEVTDTYTLLADAIETAVLIEFDDETYLEFRHDHLHESLGYDQRLYVGLYPNEDSSFNIELQQEVTLQFYDAYNLEIEPQQYVDPRVITNKAERMRQALQNIRTVGESELWYFDVTRTRYPDDPTGNKSRFEMTIVARGNNTGLVETF